VPLPHAATLPNMATSNVNIPSVDRQRRTRAGMPNNRTKANAVPPIAFQCMLLRPGDARLPVVGAADVMVSVAVPGVVSLTLTVAEFDEPKLTVGGTLKSSGTPVNAAVSITLPLKPFCDVTVTVSEFPEADPDVMWS